MTVNPKPRSWVVVGRGPPVSRQHRVRPEFRSRHFTLTAPSAIDSAPYFPALVASSCNAIAKDCAAAGESATDSPPSTMRPLFPAKGRQLLADQFLQIGAFPPTFGQQRVSARQRGDGASRCPGELLDGRGTRLTEHDVDERQHILGAMIALGGEQLHPFFGSLALRDVLDRADDTRRPTQLVAHGPAVAGEPTFHAVLSREADLHCLGAGTGFAQILPDHAGAVLGMNRALPEPGVDIHLLRRKSQHRGQMLVPADLVGRRVEMPRRQTGDLESAGETRAGFAQRLLGAAPLGYRSALDRGRRLGV